MPFRTFRPFPPAITKSIVIAPTGTQASGRTQDDFEAKDAGFLLGAECYEFDPSALKVVPEWPLVYWWDSDLLSRYAFAPKIGDLFDVRQGLCTGNNIRTLRLPWEVVPAMVIKEGVPADLSSINRLVALYQRWRRAAAGGSPCRGS